MTNDKALEAALPGEAEVVAWAYRGPRGGLIVTEEKPEHAPEAVPLVTLASLQAKQARVKELEEALEPFADFGEFMEVETEGFSDLDRLYLVPEESDVRIGDVFVSAFRCARTALKGGSNG